MYDGCGCIVCYYYLVSCRVILFVVYMFKMDINKVFTNIKELGHVNSKRDELREYCQLKIEQVTKFLPRRILNSDGGDLLDCIFNGLSDNPISSRNKVKIVDIVLQSMRKESTSLTQCGDVVSRLCLELSRLPAQDLVRWCNDSVQSIIEDNDVNMIWKDVLPETLSALSAHSSIQHCGTDMTVQEYKEQCIRTLCQCRWKEKQLVQLTAMFRDMQLPRNDHRQVVNKICSYVIDFPPDTLPALVHQLLKLCKTYHMEIVLSHLSHYFSVRLYSKLEPPPQDSESTMDLDDIVQHSPAELSRCLSTCIYHVSAGAADPAAVRRQLKAWPRTQLLRNLFLVDLALALSDKGADFRTVCLDVIRSAIEQRVLDGIRGAESAWARSVLPPDVDVAGALKVLAAESANHRQLTVAGLINLALGLLAARARPGAAAVRSLGKLVLARLCSAQPETAPHVLSRLADRLATDVAHRQYAECLHVLCALTPAPVERCTQLTAILESCQPAPGDHTAAAAVLDAVHPLLNFSTRVRDALVMVCRKGLYSRDSTHRCLALSGFLTVLRHVKLSSALSSSQGACSDQYSAHSYLTQIAVDVHVSQAGSQVTSRVRNEAMCMEVVSILRRCLAQDAAVKQLLYTKIYECVKEKPVLHESILELMYEHLSKYLDEAGTGLLLDKCVQLTPSSAVLTEPISQLLYATAQFLVVEEEELEDILSSQGADTGSAYLRSKLGSIMEQLCAGLDLGPNYVTDEPGLTDLTPESKAKSLKLQQVLSCHEALVAHLLMQCSAASEDVAARVYELYKASSVLLEQTKAAPKLGKKGSKSTLNETRETVKSQKSQKSQKDKGKAPVKVANLVKDRAGPFKPLPCVWDLNFCLRVLELLYSENVPWCSAEQRNLLRAKRDFHQWAVQRVCSCVGACADRRRARPLQDIAALMYNRIICRFEAMCDFDDQTTVHCVDLFKECLALLLSPHFSLKMTSFLPAITGLPDSTASSCAAAILERILCALRRVEADSDAEERDSMIKKLVTCLLQTATVLLEAPVPASNETCAVVTRLEDYVRGSKQDCLPLVPPLLAASYREMKESMLLDALLIKLTAVIGKIDEDDASGGGDEPTMFPAIDSRSGHAVLAHVCAHLCARHRCAEHLLQRARDLGAALPLAAHAHRHRIDKELIELQQSLLIQLCEITQWTSKLASLRCVVGGGSDRVLTACVRLYALLGAHARLLAAAAHSLCTRSYERLLKLCGKKLSTVTDNLITYLEASQQQQSASKVLRDTKLIPRLVLAAELFTKHVMLLASKTKVNYQQYLSLGTARDFRIKGPVLQEVLQARDQRRDDEQVDINDAETEILSPVQSEHEEEESDEENSRRKRRRVS